MVEPWLNPTAGYYQDSPALWDTPPYSLPSCLLRADLPLLTGPSPSLEMWVLRPLSFSCLQVLPTSWVVSFLKQRYFWYKAGTQGLSVNRCCLHRPPALRQWLKSSGVRFLLFLNLLWLTSAVPIPLLLWHLHIPSTHTWIPVTGNTLLLTLEIQQAMAAEVKPLSSEGLHTNRRDAQTQFSLHSESILILVFILYWFKWLSGCL